MDGDWVDELSDMSNKRQFLGIAIGVEGGMGLGAWVVAAILGLPVAGWVAWSNAGLAWGIAGAAIMLVVLGLTRRAPVGPLRRLTRLVDRLVPRLFAGFRWWELLLVSLLAGWGEEVLFRGLIQGGLQELLGLWIASGEAVTIAALVVASVLFGLAHAVSREYVIFATFILYSARTLQIYSGFAVAITTLIWLYLNWLILLVGAQLAFYHQNPAFLRMGHRQPRLSNAMRERLALNIMFLVGKAFRNSDKTIETRELARKLKIPSITLTPIIEGLEADGLLTSTEKELLLPGREMSRIPLRAILATVREHGETGSYRDPKWTAAIESIGADVDAAVTATVGEQSLADLLDRSESLATA